MAQANETKTHLTAKELAERLKIHPVTANKWRCIGIGPKYMKVGSSVRYPISEVEKWEQEQTINSTAQNK